MSTGFAIAGLDVQPVVVVPRIDNLARVINCVPAAAAAKETAVAEHDHPANDPPASVLARGIRAAASALCSRGDLIHGGLT